MSFEWSVRLKNNFFYILFKNTVKTDPSEIYLYAEFMLKMQIIQWIQLEHTPMFS